MHPFLQKPLILAGAAATWMVAMPASNAASDPFAVGATPANGEYTLTSLVPQNPTIAGFSGAWSTVFAASPAIQSNSLDYSSPGYAPPTGGSPAGTADGRVARLFDGSDPFALADNTVYLSVLLQFTTTDNYKALELSGGGADSARTLQLGVSTFGDFPSNSAFGFRVNNNGSLNGSLGAFDTDVHLFVVKFSLSSASLGDSVTVWEDPTIVGSGDPTGGVTVSGFDLATTDRLALANFGSGSGAFDEIRLGSTFQSVTAVPEPTSVAGIFGGLCVFFAAARHFRRRAVSFQS